jgi:hypothetical protein
VTANDSADECQPDTGGLDFQSASVVVPNEIEPADEITKEETKPTLDENARIMLLVIALLLFGFTVAFGAISSVWVGPRKWDQVKDVMTAVIPVETLIIGGAVTYWFKSGE